MTYYLRSQEKKLTIKLGLIKLMKYGYEKVAALVFMRTRVIVILFVDKIEIVIYKKEARVKSYGRDLMNNLTLYHLSQFDLSKLCIPFISITVSLHSTH